jgi:hypothetical protein
MPDVYGAADRRTAVLLADLPLLAFALAQQSFQRGVGFGAELGGFGVVALG